MWILHIAVTEIHSSTDSQLMEFNTFAKLYEIIYCLQIVYLGPSSWIWQGSVFQPQMFQSCEKFSKSFVFKALRLFFKWLILDFKIPICKTVPIILFDWKNIGHSTKLEKNGKRKTWQTRIPVGNIPISAK